MFDEPIQLPTTRFRVHTDDPTFQVAWRGGTRFHLSGEVSADPSSSLDVDTPSDTFEVSLATHSRAEHAVALLRRSLPRDVAMRVEPKQDGVEIVLQEALVPAARPPRLRIFTTDLVQRVKQLDENKVEFLGASGADCHLTVLCDSRRVTIFVPGGSSAQVTAARVGASVPHGFRALVDGPTVSVWKDADFFSAVA